MRKRGKDNPAAAAHAAGLRHVSDETLPGITRHGRPGHFIYKNSAGKRVRDRAALRRIAALAIPPAWTQVWIAPFANAHLAATGRDTRGRKQYRYHPDFVRMRDTAKYEHLVSFAQALPALRRRLKADLRRPGLPREKVLATVITLLESTLIRVGNEDYARTNRSFGLTTLRNRHASLNGAELTFLFTGKSGKRWNLSLRDRRVARVIRSCQELPGQHLFEYRAPDGTVHAVSSSDVNSYLRDISGREISAKDFRTWAGTVEAALALGAQKGKPTAKALRDVISAVAERLGNTVAVCRKCYIHPEVVEAFLSGTLRLRMGGGARGGLSAAERGVLTFLKRKGRAGNGAPPDRD